MSTIPINADESPPFVLELIYRLKVRDVMTRRLITVERDASLREIQVLMKENGITGVPVAEGKRLLGMVSVDDIIRALDEGHIEEPAHEWMTRNLIVLEEDMPLSFGISYMDKYRYGRFPVLSKGKELVGILTSRDIIVALLLEFNNEVERLEQQVTGHANIEEHGTLQRQFITRTFDFENAGRASNEVKKLLKERELDRKLIRRVSVACYELEMNQVVHSVGGSLNVTMDQEKIVILARDRGPGIPDVDAAMQEGYSTATEWVRSLGFGAGMGLPNARRVSDEFSIDSTEHGTSVRAAIYRKDANTDDHT